MDVLGFIWQFAFYGWLASAIFWGITGVAFTSWANIDVRLGAVLGALFQWLGIFGLWLYYMANRENQKANLISGGVSSGDWMKQWEVNPKAGTSLPQGEDPFALPGSALSSFQSDEIFATTTNPFDSVMSKKDKSSKWITNKPGIFILYASLVVFIAFLWSLFLTMFNILSDRNEVMGINAISTGLDFWIFISDAVIIGAFCLLISRPSRIAALLFAWIGSWWLMLATASLTARDIFVQGIDRIFQIPNLLIRSNNQFGQSSTAWAFDVGVAWFVIFFNALVLLVASIIILRDAHKRASVVLGF